MLGMDAARQGYWATYGGSPGWTFLLGPFAEQMRERGIGTGAQDAIFVAQPGPRLRLRGRLVTESAPRLGGNLTTSVVGSHAHPSWLVVGVAAAGRDELGPVDIAELQDDAVDTALRDQEEAGIDVVSDGEMRRAGFFTAEFYRHLTGLRPLQPERRVGAPGHDQQHRFEVVEPIAAPEGLGVVEEFRYARTRTRRPLKVTIPGPFTLAGRLIGGSVYPNRVAATRGVHPDPRERGSRARRRGRHVHPDRRAVAGDPSRRPGRLCGAVQPGRRRRAGRRPAGGPPVLRQLHGPAAGEADLPAGARPAPQVRRP